MDWHLHKIALAGVTLAWLLVSTCVSAQSVRVVTDSAGQPVLYPSYITEYQGRLYFRGSNFPQGTDAELWSSDGWTAERAADVNPGSTGSSPSYLTVFNDKLYFAATAASGATRLWQYDTTTGAALAPGSGAQAGNPQNLTVFGAKLYYGAFRANIGSELWSFDGAAQTPFDMFPGSGSSGPHQFTQFNGQLYFNANGTAGQGSELWRYSGSGAPTEAARIYPNNGSSPEHMAVYNGALYFSAYDGVHGRELWKYDGAAASLVADILPGGQYDSSNPSNLTVYDGKLYFSASDPIHGIELWSYDGGSAQLVGEINPTPDPGDGDTFRMDSTPADLTVFDGKLYFSANDGVHGRELWSYDGDQLSLVKDLNPGPNGSEVSELTVYNGDLFFSANLGDGGGLGTVVPRVYAFSPVPEPASAATLVLGAISLLIASYVRRRAVG